jgi:hypothetical protein
MRSYISTTKHASGITIDLLKAFEHVSRSKLAKRGARGDYPEHVIAASLATYGFRRRLVYKGYVSQEVHPRRGTTARSPFATGDLWLV